jgi:hypothetical protein
MKINHLFKDKSHNLIGLFEDTKTMSQFKKKLEKQATENPGYDRNKYVGDGFELLVELLIKSHCCDKRIGISNYVPVQDNDNGVDGYGINIDGSNCAIQVKFRGDTNSLLTATEAHLDSFVGESQNKMRGLYCEMVYDNEEDKDKWPRHFIFTTAKGLHNYTEDEKFFGYRIVVFGWEQMKSFLDNNHLFWKWCLDVLKSS